MNSLKDLKQLLRPYLIPVVGFAVVLILIPRTLSFLVPCLNDQVSSFTIMECHATKVLDYYLVIAMLSQAIILTLFYLFRSKEVKKLAITGVVLSLLTIAGYYALIPFSLNTVGSAQIDLESSFAPYSASPSATQTSP